MTLDETRAIYAQMKASSCQLLVEGLVKAAVTYSRIRVDWLLAAQEERRGMDDGRTRAHTAFIDACNILSRNMQAAGEDHAWRARIGEDRRAIGDFACYLHCLLGIMAR
jgi:hypothetical protein